MPAQTYDALLRSLPKGELAPVYYLYGPEDILKDEALQGILDRALEPALRDFNLDQRAAAQLDPESIFTLCTTLPMMAARRVVVLRDVEGWKRKPKTRAAFLKYLERPAVETVVVLVQSSADDEPDRDLVRGAFAVECEPLAPDRARRWLLRRATRLGVTLEDAAADHLLAATGGELAAVAAELEKLCALPAETPLTAEQVGALVGVRHGETVYDWRDAALDGTAGRAARMLGPLLDQSGVTAVRLISLLGTSLVGVGLARSHRPRYAGRKPRAVSLRPGLRQLRCSACPTGRPTAAVRRLWLVHGRPRGCTRILRLRGRRCGAQEHHDFQRGAILVDLVLRLSTSDRRRPVWIPRGGA